MGFYSFEMVLVGIILLSGIAAGGTKIWLQRRNYRLEQLNLRDDSRPRKVPDNFGNNSLGL